MSFRLIVGAGVVAFAFVFNSCSTPQQRVSLHPGRVDVSTTDASRVAKVPETVEHLDFARALSFVDGANPSLRLAGFEFAALFADLDQASRFNNPSLGLEMENIFGEDAFGGIDQAESTLSLSQNLDISGRRRARTNVARDEIGVSELAIMLERNRVMRDLRADFIEVLSSQESIDIAEQTLAMLRESDQAQSDLIELGRTSAAEREVTKSALALAELEASAARASLLEAKHALASHWGAYRVDFDRVVGSLLVPETLLEEGSRLGRFSWADLKNARETLLESERRLLQARARYHRARADFDELIRFEPRRESLDDFGTRDDPSEGARS